MSKKLIFAIVLVIIIFGLLYYFNSPSYALSKYIDALTSKKEEVVNSILEIRIARSRIKLHCRALPDEVNNEIFLKESDKNMDAARSSLWTVKESAGQLFPHYIVLSIQQIYDWDVSFTSYDLCSWNAPTDEEYRHKQEKVESLMQKVIDKEASGL